MPEEIGYVLSVYPGRGLPPERTDIEDKVKAEKAFSDAKAAAILWQARPPTEGLGWIKLKEKEAPPPVAPAAAPKVPTAAPAVAAPKPAPAVQAAAAAPTPAAPATVVRPPVPVPPVQPQAAATAAVVGVDKAQLLERFIQFLSAHAEGRGEEQSAELRKFLTAIPAEKRGETLAALDAVEKDFNEGRMAWSEAARTYVKLVREGL